jgi:hypothetical protein
MKHVHSGDQSEVRKLSLRQRWSEARATKTTVFWLCLASIVVTMVVGFSWGGWVTGGAAQKSGEAMARDAVIQRLAPICVAQFTQDPEKDLKLKELEEITSSWERSSYLKNQTWAIMPGEDVADSKVSDACIKLVMLLE